MNTGISKRQFHRVAIAAAASLALPTAVRAQTAGRGTVPELGQYTGADRMQRLVDGAKKEGNLSIYTSAQSDDMGALVAGFEKKYGVKASVWRAGSEKVLQRAVTEARGNRFTRRIVETQRPGARSHAPRKVFQAIKSPHLAQHDRRRSARMANGSERGSTSSSRPTTPSSPQEGGRCRRPGKTWPSP
jgi:iron(III) transport system substrate-binding protein